MSIAATWWGHSSATIDLGGVRVGLDPVFSSRLIHLRRHVPVPGNSALDVDVVLVSHLHADHLHVSSLRWFGRDVPIVVPRGAGALLRRLPNPFITVEPGDGIELPVGLRVDVEPAFHGGRRHPGSRHVGPALGFRVQAARPAESQDDGTAGGLSFWYPGDTGLGSHLDRVDPVSLAVVPIGGWGPSLGYEHLGPDDAVEAVSRVGARRVIPVHYGTYWPWGMTLARGKHRRFFVQPAGRFAVQMARRLPDVDARILTAGERIEWRT